MIRHSKPGSTSEKLLVSFTSFEPAAKSEANMSIPDWEIEKLIKEIGHKDLWKIEKFNGITVFFFRKNVQVEINSSNDIKELFADKYFQLLKRYD